MARNTFPQIPKELQGQYAVSNTSHADRIAAFKAYCTAVRDYSLIHSKCSEFSKAKNCTCQVGNLLRDERNLATVAEIAASIMTLKSTRSEEEYVTFFYTQNRPFKTDTFNVRHFVPQAPDGSNIPRHSFHHTICRGSWAKLMQLRKRQTWSKLAESDTPYNCYRHELDNLARILSSEYGTEWTTLTQDNEDTETLLIMIEATVQLEDHK